MPSTFITPEDFGAIGDGVNDDTDAIDIAIDEARGTLVALHNHYLVTRRIIRPDFTIVATGATVTNVQADFLLRHDLPGPTLFDVGAGGGVNEFVWRGNLQPSIQTSSATSAVIFAFPLAHGKVTHMNATVAGRMTGPPFTVFKRTIEVSFNHVDTLVAATSSSNTIVTYNPSAVGWNVFSSISGAMGHLKVAGADATSIEWSILSLEIVGL